MSRNAADDLTDGQRVSLLRRAARGVVLVVTFLVVVAALLVSVALLVYTAWRHDLSRGVFALAFAVFSAQIGLNWLLWKQGDEDPEANNYHLY